MRIGMVIPGPGAAVGLEQMLAQIERAERLGFSSVWTVNIQSAGYDALTMLALAGRCTERIELASFVVPTWPRHPAVMAQQALTAQVASRGRLTLGIGLGHQVVIEAQLGIPWEQPVRHMREYLACLRGLLAGEVVTRAGKGVRITNFRIAVPDDIDPPPVLVAALGPRMLELAGREAAGTVVWMGGARYLAEHAVPTISAAAAAAGRPATRVVNCVPVCVTDNGPAVRAQVAAAFERYGQLPSYRAILDKADAPDPSHVALIGTEDEVLARLRELAAAGVTDFGASIFAPPGERVERTEQLLLAFGG
ncbi:MAG: LLM class F420-dependent oxidoreductase [Chloroflexi bacterium]|nr:MAG: LLM class F420-dependent oxidoreductase [Chloroflexota bacterium]